MAKKKIDGVTYDIMEGVRVNEYGAAFKILQGKYGEDVCFNTLEPAVVETYTVTYNDIRYLERDHSRSWSEVWNNGVTFKSGVHVTNDTQYIEFGCDTNTLPDGARIQSVSIDFEIEQEEPTAMSGIPKRATYTYNNQIQKLQIETTSSGPCVSTSIDVNGMTKDAFSRNRFRFEFDDYRNLDGVSSILVKTMKFVVTYTLT